MVLPELMPESLEPAEGLVGFSSSKYRFSSGKQVKSSLNCFSVYLGFEMLRAIRRAVSQLVVSWSMQAHNAVLGGLLLDFTAVMRRACISFSSRAEIAGRGTRRMRVAVCTSTGAAPGGLASPLSFALFSLLPPSEGNFGTDMEVILMISKPLSRIQVQMFSCVPIERPSSSCWPKLKSPSVVANSWPSGNPMTCTPLWAGSRMR
mmetsp:Transcript_26756/g.77227  ORF Transcript_26756/g.77227 Transcript_26756/m.77227 type:complete len:205 (-) Transcript_26756:1019-1633(-)